jgi:hypothetical protein
MEKPALNPKQTKSNKKVAKSLRRKTSQTKRKELKSKKTTRIGKLVAIAILHALEERG